MNPEVIRGLSIYFSTEFSGFTRDSWKNTDGQLLSLSGL